MSQILKLTHENQQLKRQINQYQQVLGVSPYVNDSLFKGGYRVVKTIVDRGLIFSPKYSNLSSNTKCFGSYLTGIPAFVKAS